jgi:SAM-dependent methyltransferase
VTEEAFQDDERLLSQLYRERFTGRDLEFKRRMWAVLCERVFQRYVSATDTVVDLGAGSCEFINAIRAGRKIAVDANPDAALHAGDAEFIRCRSTDLSPLVSGSVNVIFCSNLLEHLTDKAAVLQTLAECRRVLRPNGRLLILQPNIRYLPGRYWDYFDHHTPLSHLSMIEGLELAGFVPVRVVPRFLPYTVKETRMPRSTALLRAYLRLPFLWPLFGRQMLIVAEAGPDSVET